MNEATSNLQILHRDDLPLGGFAGLKEHRLVQDRRAWGSHRNQGYRHSVAARGYGNRVRKNIRNGQI